METVLLINKHVENVLEDKPSRQEVLDFVDEIKSLEVTNRNITFAITSKKELDTLRNLWRFIHTSELYVDRDRIFFYELPKPLYDWLKTYKLIEIIDQIMLYNAFLYLSSGNYPKVKEHTFSLLKDSLLKNIDLLKSQHVPFSFIKKTIEDGFISSTIRLEKRHIPLLRFLFVFYKKFKTYPIEPFLQTDPNPFYDFNKQQISQYEKSKTTMNEDKINNNNEWESFTKGFDFNFIAYGSQKYYTGLKKSRLNNSPGGPDYSDKYLKIWKYFYVDDFDILDNIFENVKVVSRFAKKTNFSWICKKCKKNELDFEYERQEILDQRNMDMYCTECYMKEILKN